METNSTEEQRQVQAGAVPLFHVNSVPIYRGDILYHPDKYRTGGRVTAEFSAEGDFVTVRTNSGAVPTVLVSELSKTPFPENRCSACGHKLRA